MKRENEWTRKILAASNKAVGSAIEVGQLLVQANADLPEGTWKQWVQGNLKWTVRTADRFRKIGSYEPFQNKEIQKSLPASWGTLHLLTSLTLEQFGHALAEGSITPGMEQRDATALVKQHNPKPESAADPAPKNEGEATTASVEEFPRYQPLVNAAEALLAEVKALAEYGQALLGDRVLHGDETAAEQTADRVYGLITAIESYIGATDTTATEAA